jgi:hypothetical protein
MERLVNDAELVMGLVGGGLSVDQALLILRFIKHVIEKSREEKADSARGPKA